MMLSLDTAYRSFGGEVEASNTPTICRLPDSRRHQLSAIAPGIPHPAIRVGVVSIRVTVGLFFHHAQTRDPSQVDQWRAPRLGYPARQSIGPTAFQHSAI